MVRRSGTLFHTTFGVSDGLALRARHLDFGKELCCLLELAPISQTGPAPHSQTSVVQRTSRGPTQFLPSARLALSCPTGGLRVCPARLVCRTGNSHSRQQPRNAALLGTAHDQDGRPVSGVTVRAVNRATSKPYTPSPTPKEYFAWWIFPPASTKSQFKLRESSPHRPGWHCPPGRYSQGTSVSKPLSVQHP